MRVAEESWWANTKYNLPLWIREHYLPFEEMVYAFPHTADEKFAAASYYQSYRMIDFLVARRGTSAIRTLVRQLSTHAVSDAQAFAVGAGIEPSSLESEWKEFTAQR